MALVSQCRYCVVDLDQSPEVSESLAGRLALVELSPFSIGEVLRVPRVRLWSRGGYPDGGVRGGERFPGSATT